MRRLLLTVSALALVLAACGDDDDTEAATDDTTAATEATDSGDPYAPPADGGGESEPSDGTEGSGVTVADFTFEPATLEVAAGAEVTWTNEDGVAHTVTAGEPGAVGDAFDEELAADGTATVTFAEPGTFAYFCAIHPTMTGQVVVS